MLFQKRLVYTLQGLCCIFYILSKKDRSEVQIDSKEGYLTLWCHQPYPSQSLNPQTVVEFEGQEVDFSKSLEFGGSKTQLLAGLSGQVFSFKT